MVTARVRPTPAEAADHARAVRGTAWNRRFAVFWSAFFAVLAAAVVLTQVVDGPPVIPMRSSALELLLPLFVVLSAITLSALSLQRWRSVWGVLGLIILGAMATTPTVLAVLSPKLGLPIWFFLAALMFWMMVGIVSVSFESHALWKQFLLWLGAASAIAAAICEFGVYGPIPFAVTALRDAYSLSILLDLRITLSLLFLALCLVTATVRSFARSMPSIPKMPSWQLPKVDGEHTVLAPLMNPPVLVINALLFVLVSLINVVIGVVVTLVLRVLFTGAELSKLLWELFFESNAAIQLLKALLSAAVVFVVVVAALEIAEDLRDYLRTQGATFEKLLPVLGLSAIVLIGATLITLVLDGRVAQLPRILFGASLLAVLHIMGGAIVYSAAAFRILRIAGFARIGIVSLVGAILVAVGFAAVVVTNISERRTRDGKAV